jgi:hypothetical protein
VQIEEPEAMKEIRGIRQKMYEETKDLSREDFIAHEKERYKKISSELGLKRKRLISKTV